MKKVLMTLIFALFAITGTVIAQNNAADNIVGTWAGEQAGDRFRAKIVKLSDGTYQGQVVWMENDKDDKGNKLLDTKNPDKSLRDTPCDKIVLFRGLKYDAEKKQWGDTKIYDPQRGIKAKLTITIMKDGRLRLKGSVLGISESVYWTRVKSAQ